MNDACLYENDTFMSNDIRGTLVLDKDFDNILTGEFICSENTPVDGQQLVILTSKVGESYCQEFLVEFDRIVGVLNSSNSILEYSIDPRSHYALNTYDHVTASLSKLYDSGRSLMWRAVRNSIPLPDTLITFPEIQQLVEEHAISESIAQEAELVLSYMAELIKPLPCHEIETDGKGNIIVYWSLDSLIYEWTIAKSDDSWPMLRVYEYSKDRISGYDDTSVSTWHNAKSLGERFKAIIVSDQLSRKQIGN